MRQHGLRDCPATLCNMGPSKTSKPAVDGSLYRFWAADERDYPRDTT
jgi:hypothetical protein